MLFTVLYLVANRSSFRFWVMSRLIWGAVWGMAELWLFALVQDLIDQKFGPKNSCSSLVSVYFKFYRAHHSSYLFWANSWRGPDRSTLVSPRRGWGRGCGQRREEKSEIGEGFSEEVTFQVKLEGQWHRAHRGKSLHSREKATLPVGSCGKGLERSAGEMVQVSLGHFTRRGQGSRPQGSSWKVVSREFYIPEGSLRAPVAWTQGSHAGG